LAALIIKDSLAGGLVVWTEDSGLIFVWDTRAILFTSEELEMTVAAKFVDILFRLTQVGF